MADGFLESLDGIPDFLHGQFVETEREGVKGYEHKAPKTERDVAKLNDALRKERESRKRDAEALAARSGKIQIGDNEYDPDELAPIIEAHRSRQGAETITVAEATKRENDRIAKVKAALEKERDEFKTQVSERDAQLDRALLHTAITGAATGADAPVRFKDPEDVKDYIVSRNLARRNGDKIEVFELDGVTPLSNAKGEAGTVADLLALVASKKYGEPAFAGLPD